MSIHVHLLQEEDDTEADQIYVNEDGGDRTHISRSDSNLNISDDGSLDDDQDQDQDQAARQFRDPNNRKRGVSNPVDQGKKDPSSVAVQASLDASIPSSPAAASEVSLIAGMIASDAFIPPLFPTITSPELLPELSEKKNGHVELLVTVFDVRDHESKKDNLTFHLRLPSTSLAVNSPSDSEDKGTLQCASSAAEKEKDKEKAIDAELSQPNLSAANQQLEIEFEFDLHNDDSSSVGTVTLRRSDHIQRNVN